MTIRHCPLLALAAILLPGSSLAADATVTSGAAAKSRVRTNVSLSTSVGGSTLVRHDYADNPTVGQSLSIGPSYALTDKLTVGLGWSIGWEYTSTENPTGRQYSPSDISASLSHSELFSEEFTGLKLSGSLRATAPTSYESRFSDNITNLTVSLGLSRAFLDGKLTLSYGPSVTKSFATRETRPDVDCFIEPTGDTETALCENPGLNNNFSHSHNLGVGYSITDKLSSSFGIGLRQRFRNAPDGQVARDAGSGGSWTSQRAESTEASLSVSYAMSEAYSVSGGVSSSQPALDERGRLRWPFFEPAANGFNAFGVTLSGRF